MEVNTCRRDPDGNTALAGNELGGLAIMWARLPMLSRYVFRFTRISGDVIIRNLPQVLSDIR